MTNARPEECAWLVARNVSLFVQKAFLLQDISLAVTPGEVVALVGPNGAGKSTLLGVLSGELSPSSGSVTLGERALHAWNLRDRAKVRSVLAQSSELAFPFSVDDVVMLGRAPHSGGVDTASDRKIAWEAMNESGVDALSRRTYTTLSGGERQRTHAARAFAQIWERSGPRLLLLDEPTASLDPAHQHALLQAARRRARARCAVVCAVHDLNLASQYADRIVVLENGKLIAVGTPREILTRELCADVFSVDAHVTPHPRHRYPLVIIDGPILAEPHTRTTEEQDHAARFD